MKTRVVLVQLAEPQTRVNDQLVLLFVHLFSGAVRSTVLVSSLHIILLLKLVAYFSALCEP